MKELTRNEAIQELNSCGVHTIEDLTNVIGIKLTNEEYEKIKNIKIE